MRRTLEFNKTVLYKAIAKRVKLENTLITLLESENCDFLPKSHKDITYEKLQSLILEDLSEHTHLIVADLLAVIDLADSLIGTINLLEKNISLIGKL